jgi:hypothetical protein
MVKISQFKYPLSILAFLSLPFLLFSQAKTEETNANKVRSVYTLDNGQLNGLYTAYFANGVKKAEGQFLHNRRVGEWMVWDSTGEKVHQRRYENNGYDFTVSHPKPKEGDALTKSYATLTRDTNGLVALSNPSEKDIIHSIVNWRIVTDKEQNPALLADNTFYNALIQSALDAKIRIYSSENDKFKARMLPDELRRKLDSMDVELVGFRIKEMRYFTGKQQVSQTHITGLAPIVRSKKLGEKDGEKLLFWLYVPRARKELAQMPLPNLGFPADVKTYDDLFFNRYFSSVIIKTSNRYDRSLKDYLSEADAYKAAQEIEMDNIDLEHNLWVYAPTYVRK